MEQTLNNAGDYRIEVSGWGLDNNFFSETTELLWSSGGSKHILLQRAVPEGTIIFVRILGAEFQGSCLPVPYQVEDINPMDSNGRCDIGLRQLLPRLKAPHKDTSASYVLEDSNKVEPREKVKRPRAGEILQ